MTRGYFITGTGTEVGKTFITSLLLRQLAFKNIPATALKPLITGYDPANAETSDSGRLLAAMGKPVTETTIAGISPWRFKDPVSPHLAAAHEKQALTSKALAAFCREHLSGLTLVEGAGGLMSPIGETETMLDWITELAFPVILVTGSYLGTFSHTLTSLETLRSRRIVPAAIIISASDHNQQTLRETEATLRQFAPPACRILSVPRLPLDRNAGLLDNNILNNVPDLTQAVT